MTNLVSTRPAHNKEMAGAFLAGLDPNATRFTFQFFSDAAGGNADVFHGSLDEVWPKVQALNTPERGIGVFVTINETNFLGRRSENIVRPRALFVDADNKEQGERCLKSFTGCNAVPSMVVKSGRGWHFYFCTDVPRDEFSALQTSLIDRLGTDTAVKDLPRVMRLPGTLHLKDPTQPRSVMLLNQASYPVRRWNFPELLAKLGLAGKTSFGNQDQSGAVLAVQKNNIELPEWVFTSKPALAFADLPPESLSDGIRANIDEIRSAVAAIPPLEISAEEDWMKFACSLAHQAAEHPEQTEQLWKILDTASRNANGYDEAENRSRFRRYIAEAFNHENPITIATLFYTARKHGWQGWSPTLVPSLPAPLWSPAELKVSFSNIPHRRWLYGTYLIRGEVTVLASPGGAGKTALATGMAVEIATGTASLGEKIWGGHDLKVLFINAEDGSSELTRRVFAFCLAHANKIAVQTPDRLYMAGADDARVQRLSFLRTDKNVSMLNRDGFEVLEAALETLHPDLVILDPLVALCGGGNMNDNAVMSLVIRELKRLALKSNCAMLIVHHTRKGAEDGNAEAISGAAATVNLARRAVMPVPMTEKEANQLGILPSERFRYLKLVDAKSNLAPRLADSPWYKLHSVELPNAEPPIYPHGDSVQAVQRVHLSVLKNPAQTTDDQKISCAILDLIDRGKISDGKSYPYSPSLAGAANERALLDDAMRAVAKATAPQQWHPDDLKAVVTNAIRKMTAEGWLVSKSVKELVSEAGRFRKGQGLQVVRARTPWPKGSPNRAAEGDAKELSGGQLVNDPVND